MAGYRASATKTSANYGVIQRALQEQKEKCIQINDGNRDYTSHEDFCKNHDTHIMLNNSDDTHLAMTYQAYDIVDFRDGFFRCIVRKRLNFTKAAAGNFDFSGDVNRLIKFFVGFKHGELISDIECEISKRDTKLKCKEAVRAMYIAQKTRGEEVMKKTREHALWSAIAKYDSNVSGGYFDAVDISPTGIIDVPPYEITIPHNAFLEFQGWELYPHFLLGEVQLKVKASLAGCVIAQVPIEATISAFESATGTPIDPAAYFGANYNAGRLGQTHDFTQLGNPFRGFDSFPTPAGQAPPLATVGVLRASPDTSAPGIVELKTVVWGFSLNNDIKRNIANIYAEEFYMPAQSFQYEGLDRTESDDAVSRSVSVVTNYVEMFEVMFPEHGNDYTVFSNPVLKNFQVQLSNKVNIPEEKTTTYSPKLLRMVKNASETSPLSLSHDLVASYVEPRNMRDGTPIVNTRYAASDFSIPIDVQRNRNEGAFDGLILPSGTLSFQFEWDNIYRGAQNVYHNVDYQFGVTGRVPPGPQLFICRCAHWHFYRNGDRWYADFVDNQLIPGTQISDAYVLPGM